MQPHASPTAREADAPGFAEYLGIISKRRGLLLKRRTSRSSRSPALLAVGLPDVYRSSGLVEIEERREESQTLMRIVHASPQEEPYADQYVQSLSTRVLSDKSLKRLLQ